MRRSDAQVAWDAEDDPQGNLRHIAEHGLTPEEVESVLLDDRARAGTSRSSGRPMVSGPTSTGRYILVVYEVASDHPAVLRPVTAYELDEP
jgi:uncharacterized DUF497 family protein